MLKSEITYAKEVYILAKFSYAYILYSCTTILIEFSLISNVDVPVSSQHQELLHQSLKSWAGSTNDISQRRSF